MHLPKGSSEEAAWKNTKLEPSDRLACGNPSLFDVEGCLDTEKVSSVLPAYI